MHRKESNIIMTNGIFMVANGHRMPYQSKYKIVTFAIQFLDISA